MPRKKAKSRMYFTQDTEDAIIAYNKSDDRLLKNDLYVAEIGKAFDKLEKIVSNTKYSVGNIKMDIETYLLIENFTFYGKMNFHFLSFFKSSDI